MSPIKKSTLVKVGSHFIDPTDISCITQIKKKNLYTVRLKSQPNMEYPIWVKKNQIEFLLNELNIKVSDFDEDESYDNE